MPKGLKVIIYIFTAIFSFIVFLYFTFPFDVLKNRLLSDVEKSLKGEYEIQVSSVSPKLIAGVSLKGVKILKRGDNAQIVAWEADKVNLKTSIFALITGKKMLKFEIRSGKSNISGRVNVDKNKIQINIELSKFDLSRISYLAIQYGVKLHSSIDGEIVLDINPNDMVASSGKINIEPNPIQIEPLKISDVPLVGEIDLPQITIGAGKSVIKAQMEKGTVHLSEFVLEKGDIDLNLKGKVYIKNLKNIRLNVRGDLAFSEQIVKSVEYLNLLQNQKSADGTYPVVIIGNISRPQIKIGDFPIPLKFK